MNTNILEKLKKIKSASSPSQLEKYFSLLFGRYIRLITFFVILLSVGYCVYLWHATIYKPQWSDSQTKAYIKDKGRGVTFNEKGFEYDVAAAAARVAESQKNLGNLTDIFRLNQAVNPVNTSATVPNASTSNSSSSDIPSATF